MNNATHNSSCRNNYITAVLLALRIVNEARHQLRMPLNDINMTINQWLVLKIVYLKHADTPTNISNVMKTDTAAITRYVDLLVKNGFMRREHHTNDRRVIQLKLTAKGSHIAENVFKHYDGVFDNFENHLMQDELPMWQAIKNSTVLNRF